MHILRAASTQPLEVRARTSRYKFIKFSGCLEAASEHTNNVPLSSARTWTPFHPPIIGHQICMTKHIILLALIFICFTQFEKIKIYINLYRQIVLIRKQLQNNMFLNCFLQRSVSYFNSRTSKNKH